MWKQLFECCGAYNHKAIVLISARASVVAVLVAVTTLASACSSGSSPDVLRVTGAGGKAGVSMGSVVPHSPWVFGTFGLCSEHGVVKLSQVALVKPTGSMRIVDWGVHLDPVEMPAEPGTVAKFQGFTHGPVTAQEAPCNPADDNTTAFQLDVSVESLDSSNTTASGFTVMYRSGGHSHAVFVPFYLTLCASKSCPPAVVS